MTAIDHSDTMTDNVQATGGGTVRSTSALHYKPQVTARMRMANCPSRAHYVYQLVAQDVVQAVEQFLTGRWSCRREGWGGG